MSYCEALFITMTKNLDSTTKKMVASLILNFEQERDHGGPLLPLPAVRERVTQVLSISISTVSTISAAVKKNEVLKSPSKNRHRLKPVTNVSNLNVDGIRNTIYKMYENKVHVTLASVHEQLREKVIFHGSLASLRTVLKDIGFKWEKTSPGEV
uniref:Uncharacterized protein n=1 Tax=Photinus pyralis TaxID=7054 RepID=A0A1Y1NKC5_PHOPY